MLIIETGLHPHPGPRLKELDWGFDNPEWDQIEEDTHDDGGDTESIENESGPDAAWYDSMSADNDDDDDEEKRSDKSRPGARGRYG